MTSTERTPGDEGRDERPAAGPRQSDDDVAASLPPGGHRKPELGVRADVDRLEPYDEEPSALRLEDVAADQGIDPTGE